MNSNLHQAKKAKNDEFYTQLSDIEKEMAHYKGHFKDKIVYCNCDDSYLSNFVKYFACNFHNLGIKKLIASCYVDENSPSDKAISWEFNGNYINNTPALESAIIKELDGDGDFRSNECIEILKESDIVITNPPFSLFKEYISQLIKYNKDFLIIGNQNQVVNKAIFPLFKSGSVWFGATKPRGFYTDIALKKIKNMGNTCWFTNMDYPLRYVNRLNLKERYATNKYEKYDNYDAIHIDRVVNAPLDYDGVMGVPSTFLLKYNFNDYDIVGAGNTKDNFTPNKIYINPIENKPNNIKVEGSPINNAQCIRIDKIPESGSYYTASNINYMLKIPYTRIFVKKTNK